MSSPSGIGALRSSSGMVEYGLNGACVSIATKVHDDKKRSAAQRDDVFLDRVSYAMAVENPPHFIELAVRQADVGANSFVNRNAERGSRCLVFHGFGLSEAAGHFVAIIPSQSSPDLRQHPISQPSTFSWPAT